MMKRRTRVRRAPLSACLLALLLPATALAGPPLAAFSAEVDALWNFSDPAASERRFRTELERWPAGEPQALILTTQIARTQSLSRQFDAAHATLDAIAAALVSAPSHVRVRYLLERGRTFNSAGAPQAAAPLFAQALELAQCGEDEFYAVDAAHMLGIAAPPATRLEWNRKALALAETATDARARNWRAPLHNNIGWTLHERGAYADALAHFEQALREREAQGKPNEIRIARWAVARTYRSLDRRAEAQALQLALAREHAAAGTADGYVFEELAELAAAAGEANAARDWAIKARESLGADPSFRSREPRRLARLDELARVDGLGRGAP